MAYAVMTVFTFVSGLFFSNMLVYYVRQAALADAQIQTFGRSDYQLDVPTVVLGVSALALLAGFLLTESRVAHPLVDLGLLREPRFLAATLGSLVLGIGMIGLASFAPIVVQEGLGESLWAASLLVLAWSLTSVATSLVIRRVRRPLVGPLPLALAMAVVAAGQLLALGLTEDSSTWRLVPSLAVSGLATGVLNALLGREAVASVPPDRAAMGSGANNTARYLGAAIGITLFTVVATGLAGAPSGPELLAGWNVAVVVTAVVTLAGALVIGLLARRHGRATDVSRVSRGLRPGAPGT
jgi:dipeptide/tripeptide permease